MHLIKSAALFLTAALFVFGLCAHDPHNIRAALIVEKGELKAGLIDRTNKVLMRTGIDSLPMLNWAIASAISLKTSLRIIESKSGSFVGVGEYGSACEFLIDARLMHFKTSDGEITYWFDNGERQLKIFTQGTRDESDLQNKIEMAQLFGGFFGISSNYLKIAEWKKGQPSRTQFDSTAWRICPNAGVHAWVVLYSDFELVSLESGNLESRPLYWTPKVFSRQITLSPWQLEFLHDALFPLQRRSSGVIACIRSQCPTSDPLSSRRTCLHFEPGVLPGTFENPAGFPPPEVDDVEAELAHGDAPIVAAVVAGVTSFISGLMN